MVSPLGLCGLGVSPPSPRLIAGLLHAGVVDRIKNGTGSGPARTTDNPQHVYHELIATPILHTAILQGRLLHTMPDSTA